MREIIKALGHSFVLAAESKWHLSFCKSLRAKLIWIEKAVLAKRVLYTTRTLSKEAKVFHSSRAAGAQARRHGDVYFAALVNRQSINEAFGESSRHA